MGIRARAAVAATAVAATVLLGGCGTPEPGSVTTTTDETSLNACRVERATIRTALEAWSLQHQPGRYPESLQALLDDGFVKPGGIRFGWDYTSTGATYTLTGPC